MAADDDASVRGGSGSGVSHAADNAERDAGVGFGQHGEADTDSAATDQVTTDQGPTDPPPVGYSVAVEKYLDAASLSDGSRRVYRIALNTWAWLLVERTPPAGRARRGVVEPIVPLSVLDGGDAAARLWAAVRMRADEVDARTLERELSTLRGAVSWWHGHGWLGTDHAAELRPDALAPRFPASRLTRAQVRGVFGLRAGLREQTLWHLVHDGAGQIWQILGLDVGDLDETRTGTRAMPGGARADRVRTRTAAAGTRRRNGRAADQTGGAAGTAGATGAADITQPLRWRAESAELVRLLVAGRATGPVFLTDRRASVGTPARDRCPITGRGRLSYRRAAEIFTAATRPLDASGRGWTLGQLRAAGPAAQGHRVAGERVSGLS